MINYTNFNTNMLPDIEFTTTNKKNTYGELPLALDIETTSTYYQGEKVAFMYIWQLGITKDLIIYGRTWEQLIELFFTIKDAYDLGEKKLLIYAHNLGYEFQFIRKYLNFNEVFAVDERKPLKALTDLGLEFRDSYILSGHSLANLAKNLQDKTVKKLVGDLDYTLIRHSETPLTDKELQYCENDIIIVLQYLYEQIELYGSITKIPLTNTGRVRSFVRNNCYYSDKNHKKSSKGKYMRYRRIMGDLTLNEKQYLQLKQAFMGGFTHSNPDFTGKTLTDVDSIDLSSSYPTVMLADKFPMSRGRELNNITTTKQLENLFNNDCVVFDLHIENVENILEYESYISESKCFNLVNPLINNGRVFRADSLSITITDVDYNIIKAVYSWEKIAIKNVVAYRKNYLPKAVIESVLKLYEDKTTLKDVKGSEVEYLLSKGMLNSVYGMTVTDIVKDEIVYQNEWGTEPVKTTDKIDEYNESKNRFLFYPWGVWVTAYARRNLWTGILNIGKDYIYSDTDSIKMINFKNHTKFIEEYNNHITLKLNTMINTLKLDPKLLTPRSKDGELKPMGIWDYEGHYSLFKTLGAKRYIYLEGDKLKITVAGLSKQNGVNHLLELYKTPENVINNFDDNLFIPAEKTGKMTHTYIDVEKDCMITDYKGNHLHVNVKTGIHLENTEFTLSISNTYKTFLDNLKKGIIYRGINHI